MNKEHISSNCLRLYDTRTAQRFQLVDIYKVAKQEVVNYDYFDKRKGKMNENRGWKVVLRNGRDYRLTDESRELRPGIESEFFENAADMHGDSALGDEQPIGDLGVGETFSDF